MIFMTNLILSSILTKQIVIKHITKKAVTVKWVILNFYHPKYNRFLKDFYLFIYLFGHALNALFNDMI